MAVFTVHVPGQTDVGPCFGPPPHYHDEVVCAEDDNYDPSVLGAVPNDHQYGYCLSCHTPFLWSVHAQQWVGWDQSRFMSIRHEPPDASNGRWAQW